MGVDTRRHRVVLGAVAMALTVMVAAPAAAVEGDVGNPVWITSTPVETRTYEGPAAAVDPTDPSRVFVAASNLQSARCSIHRSTDGGRSFTELEGPDFEPFSDCGFNQAGLPKNMRMRLAVDAEGVVYWVVAVAEPAAKGGRSIVLARSGDRGDSWSTTVVSRAPAVSSPDEAVGNFVPDLFVSPFGDTPRTVWVSWRRSFTSAAERDTEGWAAVSTDGGRTFGPEVRPFEANPGFDAPRVVLDASGTTYWFQRERPPRPAEGEEPSPSPIRMATSTDGGRTWTEGDTGISHLVMEEPLAAVAPEGDAVYLVWADASAGDLDIFFAATTDGGRSWTDRVRVNDDDAGNAKTQKWPKMDVAPSGRIDIVWYDYRHDPADTPEDDLEFYLGDANDVYLASSTDGGRTFVNTRVTDTSIDRTLGTYNPQFFVEVPPAVGSAPDGVFVAWSDTRRADPDTQAQDIFGAAVDLSEDSSSTLTIGLLVAAGVLAVVGLALGGMALARRRA